jgi:hypothetical protein
MLVDKSEHAIVTQRSITETFSPWTSNDKEIQTILYSGMYGLEIKGRPEVSLRIRLAHNGF